MNFSSAPDAEAASDPAHYVVTVNGAPVAVESAGYNAASRSVVLGLAPGALNSGDHVTVQWVDNL